jgi:prepilin-type N-terminal cleavage/methylation domain-containing protein
MAGSQEKNLPHRAGESPEGKGVEPRCEGTQPRTFTAPCCHSPLVTRHWSFHSDRFSSGFSLLELLASLAIISILMGAVFSFMVASQKRVQGSQVVTESNQSARAALEVMSQEIGQAGANPALVNNKTSSAKVPAKPQSQCIALGDISSIFPGDWLAVDTGPSYEQVQVVATSNGALAGFTACPGANQVSAIFEQCHNDTSITDGCPATGTPAPYPMEAAKAPYPSGIIQGTGTSDDKTLMFFGDINGTGSVDYVVYSLYAHAGAKTVALNGNTYTLYTFYRSSTPVTFATGATNNPASPMVQNVLYNAALKQGPTGQPLFSYVATTVGIVPNVQTVVGTVTINLCVAVNPESLETNTVQYYDMATQIRPINLAGALVVNGTQGGGKYLPPEPQGLPMSNPGNYYQ